MVFTRATHLSRLHFRNNNSLRAEACRTAQVAPPVALSQSDKIANNGTKKEENQIELSSPMSVPSKEFAILDDSTSRLRHRYGKYIYIYKYILLVYLEFR